MMVYMMVKNRRPLRPHAETCVYLQGPHRLRFGDLSRKYWCLSGHDADYATYNEEHSYEVVWT